MAREFYGISSVDWNTGSWSSVCVCARARASEETNPYLSRGVVKITVVFSVVTCVPCSRHDNRVSRRSINHDRADPRWRWTRSSWWALLWDFAAVRLASPPQLSSLKSEKPVKPSFEYFREFAHFRRFHCVLFPPPPPPLLLITELLKCFTIFIRSQFESQNKDGLNSFIKQI